MHRISTKVVTLRKCHLIQSSIRSRYTLTSSFNNNNSDYRRLRSSTATTFSLTPIFGDNSVHRYSISRDHYLFSSSQLRVLSYFPPSDCDDGHNSVRRRKHSNYYYHRHDHHVGHDRWSLLSRRHFASQPSQSAGGDQPPQSASNQQPKKVDTDVEKVKRPLMKRIVDELVHYYHGFRLLFIDIRICARLLWQVVRGFDLSRREREQLVRTTADIFRLVPFMVFIIVPFMELALPIFVKLFPNLLPSTFQTTKDKDAKVKQQLKVKLEMAKFLQDTLEEMSLKSEGESHSEKAKEFAEFFNKIRKSGEQASNEDIIRFSKLFEDEITLDSLNRSQLTALCRLLELKPLGTNNFLRFQLRMRLRSLRADDKMITNEGIDSLSVSELQQACRARGMRALGLPADRLRTQLSQWLELSLNEKIPASLLLLSRVLYLPENLPATDQLKATIQALPETAATEAKYKIGESEGKVDNKTKIELIRQEEEAIKREREEEAEALKEEIAKKETLVDKAPIMESSTLEMATDSVGKEGQDEKKDLSREDIESLENVIDSKGIAIEKEELRDLQEEMDEYKEDLKEAAASMQAEALIRESKGAKRLGKKVGKMIAKMDELIKDLESKKESLQHGIETLAKKGEDEKLKAKQEEFVNLEELLEAARHVSSIDDKTKVEKVVDVLKIMDIDHDGKIEVDHIVKVLELVDHENIRLSPSQMRELVELVMQEEKLEEEAKFKMSKDKEKERSTSV